MTSATPNLIEVINDLREANISVFVSIYENGSWDSTKSILRQLRQTLEGIGVQNQINTEDASHERIIAEKKSTTGWLKAYGNELRRIPYLASVGNKASEPLSSLAKSGVKFDKLLYINDVVYSVGLHSRS